MGKVEEYKQKLKEYEQKRAEEAKAFNIDKVLADANKIYEVLVPELDCHVNYGPITMGDLVEINKAKTNEERAIRVLWLMLKKADPEVTLEKVQQLPLQTATAILKQIMKAFPLEATPA
jgi:hypothetical protein